MWVCLCRGVTSSAVQQVIADGAVTVEEVVVRSGAGLRCQGCRGTLEEMLSQQRRCQATAQLTAR